MSARTGQRGARRRGGAHDEEHVNHERWLVSYADMMTLLMVLFIVLFAISQVDQRKFAALKEGIAAGFGSTQSVPISGGTGLMQQDGAIPDPVEASVIDIGAADPQVKASAQVLAKQIAAGQDRAREDQKVSQARAELAHLEKVRQDLAAALATKGMGDRVTYRITDEGLVVGVVADDVFFDSGSAQIRPAGLRVLDTLAPVLAPLGNKIHVEGHANHLALRGSVYPSNWELSAARAASVVRYLSDHDQISATRLSATGFGSSKPLYPESDARAITGNRRVDLVIASTKDADVRSLLPALAGAGSGQ